MSERYTRFLDPKNDFAFKRIFGQEKNKDILIAFLNDILDHDHVGQIVDVKLLSTIQNAEIAARKQSILDVLCEDTKGAQYIVEMQVAKSKGFEKRAQYYASKAYSDQLGSGEDYHNLKEVIFLAITNFEMFPDTRAVKTDHILLDKRSKKHKLRDLYFTFVELPKFTKNIDELSNDTERWYYYLKHAPETVGSDYEKLIESTPIIGKAYKELDKAYWSPEELRTYDRSLKVERDNAAVRAQEIEDAENQGQERGRKKGRQEEKVTIAQQMLQEGLAISLISKLTGLSTAQLRELHL